MCLIGVIYHTPVSSCQLSSANERPWGKWLPHQVHYVHYLSAVKQELLWECPRVFNNENCSTFGVGRSINNRLIGMFEPEVHPPADVTSLFNWFPWDLLHVQS